MSWSYAIWSFTHFGVNLDTTILEGGLCVCVCIAHVKECRQAELFDCLHILRLDDNQVGFLHQLI